MLRYDGALSWNVMKLRGMYVIVLGLGLGGVYGQFALAQNSPAGSPAVTFSLSSRFAEAALRVVRAMEADPFAAPTQQGPADHRASAGDSRVSVGPTATAGPLRHTRQKRFGDARTEELVSLSRITS